MTQLTAELVCRAGLAIYGDEWKSPLARELDTDVRTLRRLAGAVAEGRDYILTKPEAWAAVLTRLLQGLPHRRAVQARYAAEVLAALTGRTEDEA